MTVVPPMISEVAPLLFFHGTGVAELSKVISQGIEWYNWGGLSENADV